MAGRMSGMCVRAAVLALGLDPKSITFAVNGYGDAGRSAARYMTGQGSKMVACNDFVGGVYNPDGIDPDDVAEWKKKRGTVKGYPGSREISTDEVLSLPVDVIVAAHLPNAVNDDNVRGVKARLIVQVVEGPVNAAAEKVLRGNGVTVIPVPDLFDATYKG